MAAYRRVYDSHHCRLTAKNRDQLRNSTLGRGLSEYGLPLLFLLGSKIIKIKIVYSVWQQYVLDSHNYNKIRIQIRQ